MTLEGNVGGYDRSVRIVLAIALFAVAVGGFSSGRSTIGIVAAVVGTTLLANAAMQFCLVNAVFGINTCSSDACSVDHR